MEVINKTDADIIAFGWHKLKGRGAEVRIHPGETGEVNGPRLVEMGDRVHEVSLTGRITCHKEPDDEYGFQLVRGQILSVGGMVRGVTIRHHLDEISNRYVTQWRRPVTA